MLTSRKADIRLAMGEKLTVYRTDLERNAGAHTLHAYGYPEIMLAIGGRSLWPLVKAVVQGEFCPLSLPELYLARAHGLRAVLSLPTSDPDLSEWLLAQRPDIVHDTATAKPVGEPIFGLDTRFALTSEDVRLALGWTVPQIKYATLERGLALPDLACVIDFYGEHMPDEAREQLVDEADEGERLSQLVAELEGRGDSALAARLRKIMSDKG